jgi:hypothetical protein
MNQNKLAKDLTALLFANDPAALAEHFSRWRAEAENDAAKKLIADLESRIGELRALISAPGSPHSPQEVEEMLKMMFLLIGQGGMPR